MRCASVSRFFFHLSECGSVVTDDEGREFANLEGAKIAAVQAARDIMCAEVREGRLCLGCSIVIDDAKGEHRATIWFRDAVEITGGSRDVADAPS